MSYLLFLALTAAASEPTILDRASYLCSDEQYQAAVAAASEALAADPEDLRAHGVYVMARAGIHSESKRLIRMYRSWYSESPTPAATYGLARAITEGSHELTPSACEEVDSLLSSLPDEMAYEAERGRLWASEDCDWDEASIYATLAGLEGPRERAFGIYRRSHQGEDVSAEVAYVAETDLSVMRLLSDEVFRQRGKAARANQRAVMAVIEPLMASDEPVEVHLALTALQAADDPRVDEVADHLDVLEGREPRSVVSSIDVDALLEAIYLADNRPTHELAIAHLDALEEVIPRHGEAYATWQAFRARRLSPLGRSDEAYVAIQEVAKSVSDHGYMVNQWAYAAASRGENLEQALTVLERVMSELDDPPFVDPAWAGYESWIKWRRIYRSQWEDTRGWLLYLLGRYDEAIVALMRAAESYENPQIQAHLGLALLAVGEDRRAFAHLARASAGGIYEVGLSDQVELELERLYPLWGAWHPAGLDGYLQIVEAELPVDDEQDVEEAPALHPLIGQTLPFDSVDKLGGGTLHISPVGQITVIDLWATWCRGCVAGMPHLQEVAEAYAERGVKVYGLSVDSDVAVVRRFFRAVDPPAYGLGFLGEDGMDQMNVSGIPAVFVVGPDGKVTDHFTGYHGASDRRLEAAIERLLVSESGTGD